MSMSKVLAPRLELLGRAPNSLAKLCQCLPKAVRVEIRQCAPRLCRLARERELTGINMACQLPCVDGAPISKEVRMRILAATILAIGLLSAAGQARAQTYDPGFPVCMHRAVGEALSRIAPTTRWPNVRRRLPATRACAASTRITRAQQRRRDETTGGIPASIKRRVRQGWRHKRSIHPGQLA